MLGPVEAWAEVLERIDIPFVDPASDDDSREENENGHGQPGANDPPVNLRELESEVIERTAGVVDERGGLPKIFGLGEFRIQVSGEEALVEFQNPGIGSDKTSDIDRRGEAVVAAGFQRPDMIRLDLGQISDLINVQFLSFAGAAKLFSYRRHGAHNYLISLPFGNH